MAYSATYTDDDISPAVIDGIVSFIAQMVPFATLLALGFVLVLLVGIWKRVRKA